MNQPTFAVSRVENRNGIVSWRVDGRLHGDRIRKNFKTREEAAAEKAVLELKAEQNASGLRSATTCLTNDQVREAESLFRRIEGRTRSLSWRDYPSKIGNRPMRTFARGCYVLTVTAKLKRRMPRKPSSRSCAIQSSPGRAEGSACLGEHSRRIALL